MRPENEQIVADQQRRDHRTGWDVEGLKQKGADDQRDDEGMKHHAHRLGEATLFLFGSSLHAHRPIVLRFTRPAPRSCNPSIPQAQLRAGFRRAFAQCHFIER
jgi:hypothetical protein